MRRHYPLSTSIPLLARSPISPAHQSQFLQPKTSKQSRSLLMVDSCTQPISSTAASGSLRSPHQACPFAWTPLPLPATRLKVSLSMPKAGLLTSPIGSRTVSPPLPLRQAQACSSPSVIQLSGTPATGRGQSAWCFPAVSDLGNCHVRPWTRGRAQLRVQRSPTSVAHCPIAAAGTLGPNPLASISS
jgi:hypothetical protein